MTKFILFMNLDMVDRNSAPEEFACIWQSKRVGIITIETEKNMKNYESFLTACISLMHEPDKPWSRQIAVVYEHTKTTQEKCSPIGHNNAKHVPNQEPASAWIFGNISVILGDPGAASRVGSKGATKVLKYGWKSPWPHSHRTILKNSNGCRLLIGHKKCFVLFCPIGEQFLLSSFGEFVDDGYCLATLCPVRSASLREQGKV